MSNILVTSGGFNTINNYVTRENVDKFAEIALGKRVLIIANAAPEGSGNFVARENVKDNFLNVGAIQADVVDLNEGNINMLLNYDVIYCLGGDLAPLIYLANNTTFKEVLLEFLEKGIYIGESAGSMILGPDLKYAYDIKKGTKPKYDIVLPTYAGLGFIGDYIIPHFQKLSESMQVKASNYESEKNIKITRLNDGEILFYDYGKDKESVSKS